MLNYNHLYYFHVVAAEGSVARASERLGVTQPTVSEQVKALERALGVPLFDRTATGLRLTADGRLAFEHTSIMFRQSERLVHALGHGAPSAPRALRVGLSAGVPRSTTATLLSPVFTWHECLAVVRTGDAAELLRELRAGELDLLLTESDPPETAQGSIAVVVLERPHLVAVAHPTVVPNADWANVDVIHYRPTSAFRWDVETFLEEQGLRPRCAAEADDALLLLESAARGGFAVFVPHDVANSAVANGRLRLLAKLEPGNAGVHALYRHDATSEVVRRAIDMLAGSSRTRLPPASD